jgi:hypothetical protein
MERNPTVTYLSVHLENSECFYFTRNNIQERIFSPPKTILTVINLQELFCILRYLRYYTWNTKGKKWKLCMRLYEIRVIVSFLLN